MASISKIKGFFLENGFRIFKVLQYGAKSTDECSPFGIDSNPINGTTAILQETDTSSEPVIIGYIQKKRKSEPGELRIYSVDSEGNEKAFLWLKKDGTIELNGNSDNAVKYIPLDIAMQKLSTDINAELTAIASGIATAGGSYIPNSISIDISEAKVDNVKI